MTKKMKHNKSETSKTPVKGNPRLLDKIDIDTLLTNLFVLLLLIISLISLILIREYIGYVGYDDARGGVITQLDIFQKFPASAWNGVFGIAIQSPALNTSWFIFANPADMSELNPIFPCFEPGDVHELYVTTLNSSEINWTNVTAGTAALVDSYTNMSANETASAANTFTQTISVTIGTTTISGVPAAYMRRYGVSGTTDFPVGILQYNGIIIMVAIINDNFLIGYRPDKIFNYE